MLQPGRRGGVLTILMLAMQLASGNRARVRDLGCFEVGTAKHSQTSTQEAPIKPQLAEGV